jgi:lipopolysaccharide heptosyltransferase II
MTPALVIQTSYLGDVVLTTPLIAELASRGPVDVIVTPGGASLLANNPSVSRLLVYDKRGQWGVDALRKTAQSARAPSPSAVAYCAQGSMRTALLARLAGYRERAGFDTSAGRWLYTRRVRYDARQHHAERLLRLALGETTAIPASAYRPRLYPGQSEQDVVTGLLRNAGHAGEPLLAVAPGSIWATKRWPYFPQLARRLSALGRVVVLGSDDDGALGAEIAHATSGAAIDATGKLSLLASAELIARCALLVTNDSAPQHLASAMGTPTVTVYGPTVPAFGFGPLAPGSVIAEHTSLSCRPCHPHGPPACPLGHWRCMRELSSERVLAAVAEVERAPMHNDARS